MFLQMRVTLRRKNNKVASVSLIVKARSLEAAEEAVTNYLNSSVKGAKVERITAVQLYVSGFIEVRDKANA